MDLPHWQLDNIYPSLESQELKDSIVELEDRLEQKYNKLLASTGLTDAKTLAEDFDIDIEDKTFWQSSLKIAEARAQEYIKLVDKYY